MRRFLINEKGLTMVETLLAFAVLSMVMLLITNVQLFGQEQAADQTHDVNSQANARTALKWITTDVRKIGDLYIMDANMDSSRLAISNDIFYEYDEAADTLSRNNAIIAEEISSFNYYFESGRLKIQISTTGPPNTEKEITEFETVIYVRK